MFNFIHQLARQEDKTRTCLQADGTMKCLFYLDCLVHGLRSLKKKKKKKKKDKLNIKDLAFLNENMQVETSNVCFGMVSE